MHLLLGNDFMIFKAKIISWIGSRFRARSSTIDITQLGNQKCFGT